MQRERIERKMSEMVDWSAVKYHTDEIEAYIGKMEYHKKDYTGDLRFELERLEELFKEAEEKALDALIKQDDAESEEEEAKFFALDNNNCYEQMERR